MLAALHFPSDFHLETNPSVTVQFNSTRFCVYGTKYCTEPSRDVHLPVQAAIERAIITQAVGGDDVTLTTGHARFPNPDVRALNARDFGEYVDAIYVLLACILPFVIQMNQLVQEKENKLKLLMRISGVSDTAMWLSWWLFFIVMGLIPSLLWVLVGRVPFMGIQVIEETAVSVFFVSCFTFYLSLSAAATCFSTIARSNLIGCALISPTSRPHLAHISPTSRPRLARISPSSRPHLALISPSPPPHLALISPSSRPHLPAALPPNTCPEPQL